MKGATAASFAGCGAVAAAAAAPAAAAAAAAADTSVTAPARNPPFDAADAAAADTTGTEKRSSEDGGPRLVRTEMAGADRPPVLGPDGESDVPGPYRNAMRRRYDLFARRLGAYLDSPGEEQLHGLRTSIRRLESTYGALPRSERPARCGKLVSAAKDLFRRTGPLRDSDVISGMLIEMGAPADSGAVVRLRRGRAGVFEDALLRARKIASLKPLSGAVDKIDRHKMASKRRRVIWSLFDDVRGISAIVTSDESRVEELHAMRKTVKRLRYLLEDETQYRTYCRTAAPAATSPAVGTGTVAGTRAAASPRGGTDSSRSSGGGGGGADTVHDYDASLSEVLDTVRQVQESTGSIHDCDIAIQYIAANYASLGDGAAGIFDAIQKRRHKTYLELVGSVNQAHD